MPRKPYGWYVEKPEPVDVLAECQECHGVFGAVEVVMNFGYCDGCMKPKMEAERDR